MEQSSENDIKQYNSFLRGELSAVETYQQCIDKVQDPVVRSRLAMLLESHRNRSVVLQERIRALGGEPDHSSGVWGSLVRALEGSAKVLGVPAAISVLEEGEDHGREVYERELPKLSTQQQGFVREVLYAEQLKSHDILKAIEKAL